MKFSVLWLTAIALFPGPTRAAGGSGFFIELEKGQIQSPYFNPEWFLLNPNDESVLIQDGPNRLLRFGNTGDLIGAIGDEEASIANFGFIPREGFYLLVKLVDGASQTYQIELYGSGMEFLGTVGYEGDGQLPIPNYFRQLLAVEDAEAKKGYRLFINRWQPDFVNRRNPKMLQEVQLLRVGESQWQLRDIGKPFDPQMEESAGFSSQFKLRWLVKDEETETFLSLDQLQYRIWPYSMERAGFKTRNPIPLSLERRVLPTRYFDRDAERAWLKNQRNKKGVDPNDFFRVWYSSFSHVTGFYKLGTGFVVSYTIPNETFPQFAKEGEISDPNAPLQRLCVQRLDWNLERKGPHLERSGAYMIGAAHNAVFLFHPSSKTEAPKVEVLYGYDFDEGIKDSYRR